MSNIPFSMVPLPEARSTKPRTVGLTMMMDWGLAYRRAEDYMEMLEPYVDLVKIVVGTARLYPEDYLVRKLDLYKSNNVMPFLADSSPNMYSPPKAGPAGNHFSRRPRGSALMHWKSPITACR